MIEKITYNSATKCVTLHTDSEKFPVYNCCTQNTLCRAIQNFDPELGLKLANEHISLADFIKNYAERF